jgi:hypothetical protein
MMTRYTTRLTTFAALLGASLTFVACGGSVDHGGSQNENGTGGGSHGGGDCSYFGNTYQSGESFTALDGCNSCFCEDSETSCTLVDCADGCMYDGTIYPLYSSVPAGKVEPPFHCEECTCDGSGQITCVHVDCAVCQESALDFAEALDAAKVCDPTADNQCTELISSGPACGCGTFVNPANVDALARLEEAKNAYNGAGCGADEACAICEAPPSAACSPQGVCVDAVPSDTAASCKVDGVVYPSGASGIKDPQSCNLCTCVDGQLGCDEQACPENACPPNAVFGTQCAECGPTDACLVVEHTCLFLCAEGCTNGTCFDGVCKNVCG